MQSLIAWVVAPAVLLAVAFGLGTLLESVTRLELPPGLVAPVGAALAIALALTGYVVGLRGILTPLAIVAVAAVGLATRVRRRSPLPRPGAMAALWAAGYGLFIAPVVLSGHWTWTGYDFVNDTSAQLLMAGWLPAHGRTPPPHAAVSTTLDALRGYLYTGYPLGSHALLAALHELVPIRLEAIYQPFIATFAGLAATSLATLCRRLVGARWAAFAAFTAVASNLLYQYALQGNMKEVVTASLLTTTAAVAGWSLALLGDTDPRARRPILVGSAVLLAVPVSAVVDALSTAGAPYAALIVLLWLGALLAQRLAGGLRPLAVALAAGAAALLAGTLATLSTLTTFGQATQVTYAAANRSTDLGHLVRPLEVRQTAGVWLIGDYRFPPVGIAGSLTSVGVWLVLALALLAIVWFALRRDALVLLFSLPVVLIMLVVTPHVSPYADAKTYMLMAPGVTLLGALGAAMFARISRPLGALLATAVALGVLASDGLAYHVVHLAPTKRMAAIRDLDRRFAGQGLILFNEPEEFAKNFMGHTRVNVGAEAVTPFQTELRVPQSFAYLYFDLDEETLHYVEYFPLIVVRRSPAASRPPANFRLVYRNSYYDVWRRTAGPQVLDHLPLQAVHRRSLRPRCADVLQLARSAAPGQLLIAARAAPVVQLDTARAARTRSWGVHPYRPDMVLTGGPGRASASVTVPAGGAYRAWIAGSFGRAVTGYVDGRRIGAAKGVENIGQWHEIGTVQVPAGRHLLSLSRPGGDLAPGDGYAGELGPLALEPIAPERLVRVAPRDAKARLCGQSWDWIERVR